MFEVDLSQLMSKIESYCDSVSEETDITLPSIPSFTEVQKDSELVLRSIYSYLQHYTTLTNHLTSVQIKRYKFSDAIRLLPGSPGVTKPVNITSNRILNKVRDLEAILLKRLENVREAMTVLRSLQFHNTEFNSGASKGSRLVDPLFLK